MSGFAGNDSWLIGQAACFLSFIRLRCISPLTRRFLVMFLPFKLLYIFPHGRLWPAAIPF